MAATWIIIVCLTSIAKISGAEYTDPEDYSKIWEKRLDEEGMAASLLQAATPRTAYSVGGKSVKAELYDGLDMVLTNEQRDWLYGRHKNGTRSKRGGMTQKTKPWTDGIVPYVFVEHDFNKEEIAQMLEAMAVYESETCVKFSPKSDQVAYVQFQRGTKGCNSWLGMGGKSMQPINLGSGCRSIGTYLHEMGHALGLVHEHQLPQRNEYIYYNPTHVDPEYADQLEIYSEDVTDLYGAEYDVSSIMHYEPDVRVQDD